MLLKQSFAQVSKWIAEQKPGATVEMKGPFVKFNYTPNQVRHQHPSSAVFYARHHIPSIVKTAAGLALISCFRVCHLSAQWDAVGLIAGGSGITPMYQLITEILANPRDRTEVRTNSCSVLRIVSLQRLHIHLSATRIIPRDQTRIRQVHLVIPPWLCRCAWCTPAARPMTSS